MTVQIEQVAGVQRRRIGAAVVTALSDGFVLIPAEALCGIDIAERNALYLVAGRRPPFASAINAYLVQGLDQTVLIDTGSGSMMGPTAGHVPDNLQAADVAVDDVDVVVLSHLHPDHAGGLLDDAGEPRYPQSKLMIAGAELDYWLDGSNRDTSPESTIESFELARRVVSAYRGHLHRFDELDPDGGITSVALPGHTPGHTGFVIRSCGDELFLWGDICHAPEVQCARPGVTVAFDVDPKRAAQDRRRMLGWAADEDLLVAGGHMTFPGFTRVARRGQAFVLHPDAWQYTLDAAIRQNQQIVSEG